MTLLVNLYFSNRILENNYAGTHQCTETSSHLESLVSGFMSEFNVSCTLDKEANLAPLKKISISTMAMDSHIKANN